MIFLFRHCGCIFEIHVSISGALSEASDPLCQLHSHVNGVTYSTSEGVDDAVPGNSVQATSTYGITLGQLCFTIHFIDGCL